MTKQGIRAVQVSPTDFGYGLIVAGIIPALAFLPSWRLEVALSATVLIFGAWMTGRSLRASAAGVFLGVTVVLLKLDPSALPLGWRLLAVLASLLCLAPLMIKSRRKGFPFVGLFCTMQGIYIYVGALIARPVPAYHHLYPARVRELGILGSLGYVAILVTVGMVSRRAGDFTAIRRWTSRVSEVRLVRVPRVTFLRAVILFGVGLVAARMLPTSVTTPLGAIPGMVGHARMVGLVIMVLLWIRGDLTFRQRALTVALFVVDFLTGVGSGIALYSGAAGAIGAFLLLLIRRPRAAAWGILLVMPVAVMLNAAKNEARASPVTSQTARVHLLLNNALTMATHPPPGVLPTTAERFATSDVLGYVERHIPRDYPYWTKESYTELPLALIPRVIDPSKPNIYLANQFGRRYGLLGPSDFATSMNTPIQVEAWANFGVGGLIGAGIVVGLLLGFAESTIDPETSDGLVLGVLIAVEVAGGIESGVLSFALVVPTILVFAPVIRWALVWDQEGSPKAQASPRAREGAKDSQAL
ncbi:MAG: hypothetical protein ACYC1D_00200 [Acidimicrobiales bacterium]